VITIIISSQVQKVEFFVAKKRVYLVGGFGRINCGDFLVIIFLIKTFFQSTLFYCAMK